MKRAVPKLAYSLKHSMADGLRAIVQNRAINNKITIKQST